MGIGPMSDALVGRETRAHQRQGKLIHAILSLASPTRSHLNASSHLHVIDQRGTCHASHPFFFIYLIVFTLTAYSTFKSTSYPNTFGTFPSFCCRCTSSQHSKMVVKSASMASGTLHLRSGRCMLQRCTSLSPTVTICSLS